MMESWQESARNAGGILVFLALFFGALAPATHDWYSPLGLGIAGAGMYLAASRRLYRPALTRTAEAITCRYNPWRDGTFYMMLTVPPAGGFAAIHNDTALVRLAGIAMLVLAPMAPLYSLWQARRCLLRITPDTLTVAVPAHRYAPTTIPRPAVLSIAAGTGRYGSRLTGPVTQIAYLPAPPAPSTPATALIGGPNSRGAVWIGIEQAELFAALQQWTDGDPRDPALLDRVEALLRGPATSAPGHTPAGHTAPPSDLAAPAAASPAIPPPPAAIRRPRRLPALLVSWMRRRRS